MSWRQWKPYVPVARRRASALKKMDRLRKNGLDIQPVEIEGRKIAKTFWGKAWCEHLESFSDYENRLPRGRTYVRNGSVCHLEVGKGEIKAMVSGSELYEVKIVIKTLGRKKWAAVKKRCAGKIGSLLELLQGRLSSNVMSIVTDRDKGLFPLPGEISLTCSCPDWAAMCKHVAAALYGVGARLDEKPELLFLLRGVDHEELISTDVGVATHTGKTKGKRIADDALEEVFGIEISEEAKPVKAKPGRRAKNTVPKAKQPAGSAVNVTATHKNKGIKRTIQAGKKSASRKVVTKSKPRAAQSAKPVTGKAVAALRKKFGMSQQQFATLLGVSAPCIGNWEKKPGPLNLQARSLDSWNEVKRLSRRQAWDELN